MEGFSSNLNDTFTSTRGFAEPMLPMCQLKVKITVKCQILNKQILDIMSCCSINPIPMEGFPWMCKAHVAHVSAQGQGQIKRSNIKQTNIRHYVMSALKTLYQ